MYVSVSHKLAVETCKKQSTIGNVQFTMGKADLCDAIPCYMYISFYRFLAQDICLYLFF